MKLVVIDAHKVTYRVYEDRKFLAEFKTTNGEPAHADQVEQMRQFVVTQPQSGDAA